MQEVYSGWQVSIKSKKAVCRRDRQRKWLRTGVRGSAKAQVRWACPVDCRPSQL
jgi:hypothetical protein